MILSISLQVPSKLKAKKLVCYYGHLQHFFGTLKLKVSVARFLLEEAAQGIYMYETLRSIITTLEQNYQKTVLIGKTMYKTVLSSDTLPILHRYWYIKIPF